MSIDGIRDSAVLSLTIVKHPYAIPGSRCSSKTQRWQRHLDRRIHNVRFVLVEKGDHFLGFPLFNLMFFECLSRVVKTNVPFGLSDVQAGVRCLHVAARVEAWPACQVADLIDKQLPGPLL